ATPASTGAPSAPTPTTTAPSAQLVVSYHVPGSPKRFGFSQSCTVSGVTQLAEYELGGGQTPVTPLTAGSGCTVIETGAPPGTTNVVITGSSTPGVVGDSPPRGTG